MRYNTLGNSGLIVSAVGLGCNNLGRKETATEDLPGVEKVINTAIDVGITFFDTADSYGKTPGLSETLLGQALGKKRDQVVVATKFGMNMFPGAKDLGGRGSRRYIVAAVEESLRRLGTDWIDLYQFHTPDPLTPMEETMSAMNDLIHSGKVRYIGHSNRAGWQIAEAAHLAREYNWAQYISAQNHYNLLDRRAELEVIPACKHYGLGLLPYFPLANGLLTGKYTSGKAESGTRLNAKSKREVLENADFKQLRDFQKFAQNRGLTELEVAFSWLAANPVVDSVIAGATRPEQVEQNAISADWVPTEEDQKELDEIFPAPHKIALF